jgi:prevent-host-death family protein
MTVTDARSRLSEAVDTARVSHEPVYLLRRGRRVAALIDAEDLANLMRRPKIWMTSERRTRHGTRWPGPAKARCPGRKSRRNWA